MTIGAQLWWLPPFLADILYNVLIMFILLFFTLNKKPFFSLSARNLPRYWKFGAPDYPRIHPSIHAFISRKYPHNENNNAIKMTITKLYLPLIKHETNTSGTTMESRCLCVAFIFSASTHTVQQKRIQHTSALRAYSHLSAWRVFTPGWSVPPRHKA